MQQGLYAIYSKVVCIPEGCLWKAGRNPGKRGFTETMRVVRVSFISSRDPPGKEAVASHGRRGLEHARALAFAWDHGKTCMGF